MVEHGSDKIADSLKLVLVGVGIGGSYDKSIELNVLNYKEAPKSPNKAVWE